MIRCSEYSNCYLKPIDGLIKIYLKNIIKVMMPNVGPMKIFYLIIRIIHILGILFMFLGIFLPKDFRQYHIIFCLFNLLSWKILSNKCYMSLILQYSFHLPDYPELLPSNMESTIKLTFIVLFISLIGMMNPKFSLFNLIGSFHQYLTKFN